MLKRLITRFKVLFAIRIEENAQKRVRQLAMFQ